MYQTSAHKDRSAIQVIKDIAYVSGGSRAQFLDLYLPPDNGSRVPLVIWIHGGAFLYGDKEPSQAQFLADFGFAVASLNYRLTNEARAPAQVEDCNAAIRFLRANAPEFGVDSDRFGVWGESAGGYLAAMVGLTGRHSQFDVGGHMDQSSAVQAVCDWFGPTCFPTLDGPYDIADRCDPEKRLLHFGPDSPSAKFLGQPIESDIALAYSFSPVAWATWTAPPFLIVHGDEDEVIPLGQSRELVDALRQAGATANFVTFATTGHGDGLFRTAEANAMVRQFFTAHLSQSAEHS